jgi:hypothetical protein
LLIAAAVVFIVSAITIVALAPTNFDSPDPSRLYEAAWLVAYASLFVLIISAITALVRYFAKPS